MDPKLVAEENHHSWGLTLSLSQLQPRPPSPPSPQPPSPATTPPPLLPSPFEYTPLPLPTQPPQQLFPSMLVQVYQPNTTFDFPPQENQECELVVLPPSRRQRALPSSRPKKPVDIEPPFSWATSKRATVYNLNHLISLNLTTITGTVECKECNVQREIEFDLREKFKQVADFIVAEKVSMCHRAHKNWTNPVLPNCESCGHENSMKPVITKKRGINWLFLLLGQMIGVCSLKHLKYFCKHSKIHRTGAKDRLLYLTYLGLCRQLYPEGNHFDP